MCFRLYIAARGASTPDAELSRLAVSHGLDVRTALGADTRFLEVAWGDCACSLYTRGEGRERVIAFVRALLDSGLALQLLLFQDGETLEALRAPPLALSQDAFFAAGLQGLPEARVVELVAS
jgi:hypothetical protein